MESAFPGSNFQQYLEHCHDLFVLSGTAAATLMGVLFISLSLHLDTVVHEDNKHIHAMALESFYGFMWVMVISMFMLVPLMPMRPLSTAFIMLGAVRIGMMVLNSRHLVGKTDAIFTRKVLFRRFIPPFLGNASLVYAGWSLIRGNNEMAIGFVFWSMFMLLITATGAAWDLLMRVGRLKALLARAPGGASH